MRVPAMAAALSGLLAVPGARADIPPLPGEQERMLQGVIEGAGHGCGKVESFKPVTGADAASYTKDMLTPFVASCVNGKTYLVATPLRRPPRLDPNGNPLPPPPPVVKEIEK